MIHRVEHVMGMPVVAVVRDGDDMRVLDELFDWLIWVDATFSTFEPESEISRIRRGELAVDDAHVEVRGVLARCERLREETGGYFDARRCSPDGVDPSGLVKGLGGRPGGRDPRPRRSPELRDQRRRRHPGPGPLADRHPAPPPAAG